MIPVETVPGIRGGGDKGEQWRGWMQIWYIWYILRTFANATMYNHPAQQQRGKVRRGAFHLPERSKIYSPSSAHTPINSYSVTFDKTQLLPGSVTHICNPSYSGGRDQEDHSLKPT
jgi:hypothetical protein